MGGVLDGRTCITAFRLYSVRTLLRTLCVLCGGLGHGDGGVAVPYSGVYSLCTVKVLSSG